MIQVQSLTKLYEDHLAVDDLCFRLERGQICGLVGPNGAGKTTTMRCLAGLIPPTGGALSVADYDVTRDTLQLKKQLAYVPDDPPLFDDLTVGQHLDFIGRLYEVSDHREKANELMRDFDLIDKVNAGATTLSRGMRQKLAICCAYLFDPKVLLLDEPLTGLDPPGIRMLLQSVQDRAARGTTVIISSHLLAMIEDVVTHLMMMGQGKLQYFGDAETLRSRFPQAKSLEQAYFAATTADANATETDGTPGSPKTPESQVLSEIEEMRSTADDELRFIVPTQINTNELTWGGPLNEASL